MTGKKILMVLMLCMFVLSLASVSAVVKSYDKDTKTVTMKSSILFIPTGDIAEVQLLTPLHNKVGLGYQRVAEFEVRGKKDFDEIFYGLTKTYNKHKYDQDEKIEIEKNIEWKYKTTEQVLVKDYSCPEMIVNEYNLPINSCSISGSHYETKEIWLPFNKNIKIKKDETIIIGLYTTTQKGDYIEWIPEFAGKEIKEWASWSAGLLSNVLAYWEHDDSSTTITDQKASYDLTTTNSPTPEQTGVIDYSYLYSETKYASGSVIDPDSYDAGFSTNVWLYVTSSVNGDRYYAFGHSGGWGGYELFTETGATRNLCMMIGTGDSSGSSCGTGTAFALNTWFMVTTTHTPTSSKIYVDGSLYHSFAGGNADTSTADFYISRYGYNTGSGFEGKADLMGLFGKELTTDEIDELYNEKMGCDYNDCISGAPTITLNSPANDTTKTLNQSVFFNSSITESVPANVSLYLDGIINETNSSGDLGDYYFTKILSEGIHIWTIEACSLEICVTSTRTITIDTTPNIQFETPTKADTTNQTTPYIPVNVSLTETYFDNLTFEFYLNGAITDWFWDDDTRFLNDSTFADGTWEYNVTVWTTTGRSNSTETRSITIDSTAPAIITSSPASSTSLLTVGDSLEFNFTATDGNLDTCLWNYNGTNYTESCTTGVLASVPITQENGNFNIWIYANDTFGNMNVVERTWAYHLYKEYESYTASVLEGASNTFTLGLLSNGTSITLANLSYTGSQNIGSVSSTGNNYTITKIMTAPLITTDTNNTFFWKITSGSVITLGSNNQTVLNLGVDDCTANTHVLYNFTLVDEKTQTKIPTASNSSGKIDFNLYSTSGLKIANFSKDYPNLHYYPVCLNNNLEGSGSYLSNLQVQYKAKDYSVEFYNIQNATITSSDINTTTNLYDLDNTTAQVFEITYRDASYLPVQDALVTIQRKYIDEGVFRTVEAPLTNSDGIALAHLEQYDAIYNFVITKNGILLATFSNQKVKCQNLVLGTCEISFNAFASAVLPEQFTTVEGMSYTLAYDNATREVTGVFSITAGTISTVSINVTLMNATSIELCTNSLTSTSGTLSCTIPSRYTKGTALIRIYQDGVFAGQGTVSLSQNSPKGIYGSSLVFLSIFMFLTLFGVGISSNPTVTGIFLFIGAVIGVAMNITASTGFIGVGATILWLLIAIILIISKGANRN